MDAGGTLRFGHEQAGGVHVLDCQQLEFFFDATGISGKAAVAAHHPVARDDDAYGIAAHRSAYGLRGHVAVGHYLSGDVLVGDGLSVGNFSQDVPDGDLKRSAGGPQGRRELRLAALEIAIQPIHGPLDDRGLLFLAVGKVEGKMFLSLKPHTRQGNVVAGEDHCAQRGKI